MSRINPLELAVLAMWVALAAYFMFGSPNVGCEIRIHSTTQPTTEAK